MANSTNQPLRKGFIVKVYDNNDHLIEVYQMKYRIQVKKWVRSCDLTISHNGHTQFIPAKWYGSDRSYAGETYIDLCDRNSYAMVEEIGA